MERIENLVKKLKEQLDQQAGADEMLVTLQLLQFELTKQTKTSGQSLGTAKVAVVLPVNNIQKKQPETPAVMPEISTQKVREEKSQEVVETLVVEDGSVSVLQKNGQLDMVFDPMLEIPTLSHQVREREINDTGSSEESLNDKHKMGKPELVEILKGTPVKDLRKAIGINDRYLFINDLFRGDESMYERSLKTINNFNIYPEAEYWINRELKIKLGWDNDHPTVQLFDQLVKRRYS